MIDLTETYALARDIVEENMLTDEGIVFKRVPTTNNLNEQIFSFSEDATYPCRIVRPSDRRVGEEGNFGERGIISGQIEHIIKFPWDTDITRLDQIEVNGSRYEVQNLDKNKTDRLVLDCFCVLIEDNVSD